MQTLPFVPGEANCPHGAWMLTLDKELIIMLGIII